MTRHRLLNQGARAAVLAARLAAALVVFGACAQPAAAVSVYAVNAVRQQLCTRDSGIRPLREVRALDQAATYIARGVTLHDALAAVAYEATEASAIPAGFAATDQALIANLGRRYCHEIARVQATQLGIAERGGMVWLVVATPLALPRSVDGGPVRERILKLVNDARSVPRSCGTRRYPAAAPLELSDDLSHAALVHSQEMARTGTFEHWDDTGYTPADRVRRTNYHARLVGENIAAGVSTADEAVKGWLDSPGHCENLMEPRFTHLGAACATNPAREPAVYWTLDLAEAR